MLQWDAWHDERVIKQAETALLVHPWNIITDRDEAKDLLDYYGDKYDPYLIMMAKAIDTINACRVGEADKAWAIAESLLEWYRPPFLTTTESPWNECGSFLTGMGGYLQVFMFGFAGIQINEDQLIIQPCLPSALPSITLRGISYQGQAITITCTNYAVNIEHAEKPLNIQVIWQDGSTSDVPGVTGSVNVKQL